MSGSAGQVPAGAQAVVDLLNSTPHATPVLPDRLDEPAEAARILGAFGAGERLAPERMDLLKKLRGDLMDVVTASDEEATARAWEAVTARAGEAVFRLAFTGSGGAPELRQQSGDPLLGVIAVTVADLVRDNLWSRVRVCGNEMCSAVFYDVTRSRTQRWHSYELCGNRSNVAAYRARHKEARPAAPSV